MLAASLIDLDEKTIPDAITIPGTLAGAGAGRGVSLVAAAGRICGSSAAGRRSSFSRSPRPAPGPLS